MAQRSNRSGRTRAGGYQSLKQSIWVVKDTRATIHHAARARVHWICCGPRGWGHAHLELEARREQKSAFSDGPPLVLANYADRA
jgi:hypothetical protein